MVLQCIKQMIKKKTNPRIQGKVLCLCHFARGYVMYIVDVHMLLGRFTDIYTTVHKWKLGFYFPVNSIFGILYCASDQQATLTLMFWLLQNLSFLYIRFFLTFSWMFAPWSRTDLRHGASLRKRYDNWTMSTAWCSHASLARALRKRRSDETQILIWFTTSEYNDSND